MRKTTLLFLAVLSALNARAGISAGSNDDDRPTPAPVENLYFTTDEFIYVPIFTTSMGFRMMTGAKTSFAGQSIIKSSLLNNGSATGVYVIRTYQDGTVGLDSRSNSDGSPFESADGNTTQFSYKYGTQESVPGYLTFTPTQQTFRITLLESRIPVPCQAPR